MAHLTQLTRRSAVPLRKVLTVLSSRQYSAPSSVELKKEDMYPKLGNRDIVGFGFNGYPNYMDRPEFPCPAVRFRENTEDVVELREKELGDWNQITLQDKKALYRASFRETYSEMKAPTGEWKSVMAMTITAIAISGWVMIWMRCYVYPPMPSTITREWQEATVKRMILQRQGPVEGLASQFDYEKNQWK